MTIPFPTSPTTTAHTAAEMLCALEKGRGGHPAAVEPQPLVICRTVVVTANRARLLAELERELRGGSGG